VLVNSLFFLHPSLLASCQTLFLSWECYTSLWRAE